MLEQKPFYHNRSLLRHNTCTEYYSFKYFIITMTIIVQLLIACTSISTQMHLLCMLAPTMVIKNLPSNIIIVIINL